MAVNPNDYLVSWLKFDESTTKDECGNTWTATGSPTIASGKFGSSAFCSRANYITSNKYFVMPDIFTIDFWIKWTDTGKRAMLTNPTPIGGLGLSISTSQLAMTKQNYYYIVNSGISLSANVWHHIAIVRTAANNFKVFLNGTLTFNVTGNYSFEDTCFSFGDPSDTSTTFYIDEFRFFSGIARWTSNFAPPDASDYITEIDTEFTLGTSRIITRTEGITLATVRQISNVTNFEIGTERQVENITSFITQFERQISNITELELNTRREVIRTIEIDVPTLREILRSVTVNTKTRREILKTINFNIATNRKIRCTLREDDKLVLVIHVIDEQGTLREFVLRFINPAASDNALLNAARALISLTNNTYYDAVRIEKQSLNEAVNAE